MTSIRRSPTALVALMLVMLCLPISLARAGIIEGPDPVGSATNDNNDGDRAPEGTGSTDEDDALALRRTPDSAVIVWAEDVGGDHDIRFSDMRAAQWRERAEFLSSSPVDELDPRAFVDGAGTVYVVWWENATPETVVLTRREAGSSNWWAPLVVTQDGRRPAVAAIGDEVLVAFERDGMLPGEREVVVVSLGPDGRRLETLATTDSSAPLNLRLEVDSGAFKLSWAGVVFERAAGGGWSPALEPAR